jgi:3-hydroxyacyl-[acyl-carrier-protein] dehydratase
LKFELIDAVIDRQPDSVVTVKCVTAAEEYLADHFPSFPVLPGVMMLEAMVQSARVLLEGGPYVLAEVRNLRYGNMVRPGQQLRITVERLKTEEDGRHTFQGRGTVNDLPAVQGKFVLRPLSSPAQKAGQASHG